MCVTGYYLVETTHTAASLRHKRALGETFASCCATVDIFLRTKRSAHRQNATFKEFFNIYSSSNMINLDKITKKEIKIRFLIFE